MSDLIEQIKDLQGKLQDKKEEAAKVEGAKEALLKKLKEQFGLDSIEDAQKKVKSLSKELDEKEKELGVAVLNFKNNYEL